MLKVNNKITKTFLIKVLKNIYEEVIIIILKNIGMWVPGQTSLG